MGGSKIFLGVRGAECSGSEPKIARLFIGLQTQRSVKVANQVFFVQMLLDRNVFMEGERK